MGHSVSTPDQPTEPGDREPDSSEDGGDESATAPPEPDATADHAELATPMGVWSAPPPGGEEPQVAPFSEPQRETAEPPVAPAPPALADVGRESQVAESGEPPDAADELHAGSRPPAQKDLGPEVPEDAIAAASPSSAGARETLPHSTPLSALVPGAAAAGNAAPVESGFEVPKRITLPRSVRSPAPPEAVAAAVDTRVDSFAWPAFARACLTLAAAGASVVLTAVLVTLEGPEFDRLIQSNLLAPGSRLRALIGVLAGGLAPVLVAGSYALWQRAKARRAIERVADLLAPLCVAFVVPALLSYRVFYHRPLVYLTLLSATVLVFEQLLRRSARAAAAIWGEALQDRLDRVPQQLRRAAPLLLVLVGAAVYSVYASYYTLLHHHRLGTAAFDLGIFDNLMFNAMSGRPFYSSVAVPQGSYLSNHAEFAMLLFVPLYALQPGAETLLIGQSCFIGFASVPLYLFAATRVPRASAALLALTYLLFAPLHGANFYDFHWMPMSLPFYFLLFVALAHKKLWLAIGTTLVLLLLREDISVTLAVLGVFLVLVDHWAGFGAVLTLVSLVWFVAAKFVVMPLAGPWWFSNIYKDLVAPGEMGYGSIVRTIVTNPNYFFTTVLKESKLIYFLHMAAPLAFVPLRRVMLLVLFLSPFFFTLMTTGYPPTISLGFQYSSYWVPWLFAGSAVALGLLAPQARRAALGALCLGVLCHSYVYGALLQRNTFMAGFGKISFEMSQDERELYQGLKELSAMIPDDAPVAATEQETPHISARSNAYALRTTHGHADYLLVHQHHLGLPHSHFQLQDAIFKHPYGLLAQRKQLFLFKKGHRSADTPRALSALGLRPGPHPSYQQPQPSPAPAPAPTPPAGPP